MKKKNGKNILQIYWRLLFVYLLFLKTQFSLKILIGFKGDWKRKNRTRGS